MSNEDMEITLLTAEEQREVMSNAPGLSGTIAEGNLDITDFIHLVQDMLAVDYPRGILVPAYPKYLKVGTDENAKTMDNPTEKYRPTITYKVIKREPGTIGGNKQPFGTGQKDWQPRERARIPGIDGETVIYGQWFDNLVRFDIWCLTNTEVEALVNWFEQYLRVKRSFLRNMGIGEILFWSRGEDETVGDFDNRLERRSLTFFIRTEELSSTDEGILKNLEVKLGIRKA